MEKRKVIIDTDTGGDDTVATLMAFRAPNLDVVALTVVFGNTTIEQATVNAAYLVANFASNEIPVFKGAGGPLVNQAVPEHWAGHGPKGLGVVDALDPSKALRPVGDTTTYHLPQKPPCKVGEKHAAVALIDLANQYPGEIELLMLGPLTNLAIALQLQPNIVTKFKRLYIMGGTVYCKGNTTLTGEFNWVADPDSAHVVLSRWRGGGGSLPVVIPWEPTSESGLCWEEYDEFIQLDSPEARFVAANCVWMMYTCRPGYSSARHPKDPSLLQVQAQAEAEAKAEAAEAKAKAGEGEEGSRSGNGLDKDKHDKHDQDDHDAHTSKRARKSPNFAKLRAKLPSHRRWTPCDAYAAAVLIDERVVARATDLYGAVERAGTFTQGTLGLNWYHSDKAANLRLVEALDTDAFAAMLWNLLAPHSS